MGLSLLGMGEGVGFGFAAAYSPAVFWIGIGCVLVLVVVGLLTWKKRAAAAKAHFTPAEQAEIARAEYQPDAEYIVPALESLYRHGPASF